MITIKHFIQSFVILLLGVPGLWSLSASTFRDMAEMRPAQTRAIQSAPAPTGADNRRPDFSAAQIQSLDVSGLAAGVHRFKFNAGSTNTGEAIWVPILVIKGQQAGPRLLLTSAVHGDELNGISVIHGLLDRLTPDMLRGTLIVVPGVNQPGMNANSRHFVGAGGGGFMADLNRLFPGRLNGGSTAERYVGQLWRHIFSDNADYAVDLHTQTRGSDYPLFVFSDFRNEAARQMAFDLSPDLIKNDAGQSGTLETTFLAEGVPAVTFEVGGPKRWQPDLILRAVLGLENMMRGLEMLPGARREGLVKPFVGANSTNVYADEGGFAYIHVALKEPVSKGQKIATMVDAFGREKQAYYAPHDGVVLSVATDPLREPGSMLVRILH